MANTARQNILANIKTVLQSVTGMNTVNVSKLSISDLNTYPVPMCFVFSGDENKDWDVINYESWTWPVFIEVWALDTDMETWLGLIHDKMALDNTRGGYALDCERVRCSAPWLIDPDNNLAGMLIEYKIQYRILYGKS